MEHDVSQQQLYHIINRAVSKCVDIRNSDPVNTEIKIYCRKYEERKKANSQLNIFEPPLPLKDELKYAVQFLNDLEDYRRATDVYIENEDPLPEEEYRRLLAMTEIFEKNLTEENQSICHTLKENFKRYLPEFKQEILMADYIKQADRIYDMKRGYERCRRKNKQSSKNYETETCYFFRDILRDEDLKKIQPCPQKIKLYQSCIRIVDCLPPDKYRRTAKFKLKKDLNYGLRLAAGALGEEYSDIAQRAEHEERRFQNAIEKTQIYYEKSNYSYNKRLEEEWLYR